jgi:uncharacterized protein (TIGR02466 family)
MQAFAYFPAIVCRDERPDLVERILPTCLEHLDRVRDQASLMCQSAFLAHEPALRELSDYLLVSAVEILRDQGYAVERYDFHISGLWAQEVKKGAGTNVHVHKNSQISGWFFLDVPENGAYPIYHDTRTNKAMVELDFVQGEEVANATSTIHFNNMQSGSVLFANSWMQHQLVSGSADRPTHCVNFIISHKDRPCSTC